MSVVIGQLQIDASGETDGEAAGKTAGGAKAAAAAPPKRAPAPLAATPPPPVRVETQRALRHHRERLARLRSS